MSNALIAWPNRADTATLSSGSWDATLVLNNLKDRRLGVVARTTNDALASTKFDVDLGRTRAVRLLALCNHNFSNPALWRVRGSAVSNFATTVYDSGWVYAVPSVYDINRVLWEDDNFWTLGYEDDERTYLSMPALCLLPSEVTARYWRVEIDDTANTAGYIQIGRLFIADAFQTAYNMTYGSGIAVESRTTVNEAVGGAEYFEERASVRNAFFNLDALSEEEAMMDVYELKRQQGISREVFYVWSPDDTLNLLRRSFLGRLRELSPIENPYPARHRAAFTIKELR